MGEKCQTISPLKVHIRFIPPKYSCILHTPCILLGRVCTKVVETIVKFQSLDFAIFYSFSLTWDRMGVKFQKTSSLKEQTKFGPQNSCIIPGRVSNKVVKRIVKFEILNFWQIFCSFLPLNMVVNGKLYKGPRGHGARLGHLPDGNKLGLNGFQACSYKVNTYVAKVTRMMLSKF